MSVLSKLVSFIQLLVKALLWPFKKIISLLFHSLLGLSWDTPNWLKSLNRSRKERPAKFWFSSLFSLLIIAGLTSAALYQLFIPKPPKVVATLYAPEVSANREIISPEPLIIDFEYESDHNNERSFFSRPIEQPPEGLSVAPLQQVDKVIQSGIKMFPNRAGEWRWIGDNRIEFTPKADWPADQEYQITFDKTLIADHIEMADLSYNFTTPSFYIQAEDFRLYKDPTKQNAQYLVATLSLSHPVEKENIRDHIHFEIKQNQYNLIVQNRPTFEINYGLNDREIYLKSDQITLPEQEEYAHLVVSKGLSAHQSAAKFEQRIDEKILLPDVTSFFKVSDVNLEILRNQENQPEQILTLQFTDGLTKAALSDKLEIYALPDNRRRWTLERARAHLRKHFQDQNTPFTWMENEQDIAPYYNLKLDVPEKQAIYVRVNQGVTSSSDFKLARSYEKVIYVQDYPKEVSIMGEGSLLSLSGDKTISLMSRGHTALKVSIHKLQDNQLNHLITQTGGDISNPYFSNYQFSEDNIAVEYEQILRLNHKHPKALNYASLPLATYLKDAGMGVFFIEASGWDMNRNRKVYGSEDKRLIVISDLGVLVKKTRDFNRQHVFIQSIKTGKPVANAQVDVLGKNGLSVFSGQTNAQGHLEIHDLSRLNKAKSPTVFSIIKGKDRTFLPYHQYTRQINYSRFDVSGTNTNHYSQQYEENKLSAYIFTDRGIYRPGETVQFANIVKDQDFRSTAGVPLKFIITDARSKRVFSQKLTLNKEGFFDLDFKTELTSSTGRYQASLFLLTENGYQSKRLGTVAFSVEEFQPDTMKISSELAPIRTQGWFNEQQLNALVSLKNLFGTPAQDRKVTADLKLSPSEFSFNSYPGFRFVDPLRDDQAQLQTINEQLPAQKTDADGLANFELKLNQYAKGTYRMNLDIEGFEPGGGRSVFTSNSALISPLEHLVGYKADGALNYLKQDQSREIKFVAVNSTLESIALNSLKMRLVHKQPVSTLVMAKDGTYSYQSVIKSKTLEEKPFNLSAIAPHSELSNTELSPSSQSLINNSNRWALNTTTPGNYQLQLLDSSNQLLTKLDYQVIAEGNMAGQLEQNAELTLKLNKSDYKPGEWIELNIIAPYSGSGLITIESHTVHAHKWFKSDTNSTVQKIQLPKDIEGNAYINVAFIRAQDAAEIFTSPLSYAVKNFNIDRSSRQVAIDLSTPKIARPGQPMKIGYSTDKASKVVVFAVDEGILQVADYQQPKPLDHFLSKKALQVRTFQMLDLILPEYKALLKHAGVGGGAHAMKLMAANLNPFQRSRDVPAVFWSGILDANQQEQQVQFDVPDTFSGNLKVMAVVVSEQAIGTTANNSLVRGPFVLSANVLNTAAPGDEFEVSLGVANLIENSGKDAEVDITVSASDNLQIVSQPQAKLLISEGNESSARFTVKVKTSTQPELLGEGKLTFTAQHKDEQASRSASLSVRPAVSYQTRVETGFSDQSKTLDISMPLYQAFGEKQVIASASPMLLTKGYLAFLNNYVHGCTEQISSQVFPWLNLTGQPEYFQQRPAAKEKLAKLIQQLQNRQQSDGGFSPYSGGGYSSLYPSLYATHLLTEAKFNGFLVPSELLTNALNYVRDIARQQPEGIIEARQRAIAIYLLIRNEEVATSYLMDLHQSLIASELNWQQDVTSSYLAAGYQLLKKSKDANTLINYFDATKPVAGLTNYQTADTQFAQHVYLVSSHFPEQHETLDPLKTIEALMAVSVENRLTTINTAYATLAINAFSSRNRALYGKDAINFKVIEPAQTPALSITETPFPEAKLPLASKQITVSAQHPFYYQSVVAGYPSQKATTAISEGIEIVKEFYDVNGEPITEVKQGQDLNVSLKIRITDQKRISDVAIVDLQPGGFEIKRSSVSRESGYWRSDYIDIREDRVVIYGTFNKGVTEINYQVKATATGNFTVPAVFAEAMYDPQVFGLSASSPLNVQASE